MRAVTAARRTRLLSAASRRPSIDRWAGWGGGGQAAAGAHVAGAGGAQHDVRPGGRLPQRGGGRQGHGQGCHRRYSAQGGRWLLLDILDKN